MLRFVPPAGTPLGLADVVHGSKAAFFNGGRQSLLARAVDQIPARYVFGMSSGRAALWLILKALQELKPGRSVVVLPAYTCFTVPAAIVRAGLKPLPAEINPETLDYDFSWLEEIPAADLLCIITANLFGLVNDLEYLREIARAKGAFVVDDAAQALGARSGGSWAGLRGDVGVFSFGRGKALAAIEGGLAVTDSEEIAAGLRAVAAKLPEESRFHDVSILIQMLLYAAFLDPRLYWIPNSLPFLGLGTTEFAPNFPASRISAITSALLARISGRLEGINRARVDNACFLGQNLAGLRRFSLPKPLPGSKPVYTRFPVIARDRATRDRAVSLLRAAGIGASPFYPGAICDIPGLKPALASGFRHCPAAESLASRLFTLPTHSFVSRQDISRMAEILREE